MLRRRPARERRCDRADELRVTDRVQVKRIGVVIAADRRHLVHVVRQVRDDDERGVGVDRAAHGDRGGCHALPDHAVTGRTASGAAQDLRKALGVGRWTVARRVRVADDGAVA